MHNSESIVSFASCIPSLVAVLKSLGYEYDLKSTSVLNQVVSKLPPNMKESWFFHSVKKWWRQPAVLDFNDWLRDKAEAHELMRVSQNKSQPEETPKTGFHKPPTKIFAAASKVEKPLYAPCLQCKGKHPLWSCSVFKEQTPTQRAQFSAQNRLCFACFQPDHKFRNCPKARKCTKPGCDSTHNVLLHGAEKIFSVRSASKELSNSNNPSHSNSNSTAPPNRNKPQTSSSNVAGSPSYKKLTGLLPLLQLEISSPTDMTTDLVMCDSCCTYSWVSAGLAQRLNLTGQKLDILVNGFNSTESVPTQQVEVNVFAKFEQHEYSFRVTPFVKDSLSVGSETIDVPILQDWFPHLQSIKPIVYNYSDVEMMLEQDVFHAIKPLEYFQGRNQNTPVAVSKPIGWVLSGPLPSPIGVRATNFKCNEDVALADPVNKWYELYSYGTFKQADPRSSADKRTQKFLDSTTLHDGSRSVVGMLWAEDNTQFPDEFYASLVQFKSLEKRLEKDLNLKTQYVSDIRSDVEKGYVVPVSPHDSKNRSDREWYVPHHPVLNPNKPGNFRRVLNGASNFHGKLLNNSLLVGPDLLQNLLFVLMRFREHKYAISADIEGMFMQVGLLESDQRSLRFLWREDPTSDVSVFQYARHIVGAKDSPTLGYYALRRTPVENQDRYPDAACAMLNNFYMDDYLGSVKIQKLL